MNANFSDVMPITIVLFESPRGIVKCNQYGFVSVIAKHDQFYRDMGNEIKRLLTAKFDFDDRPLIASGQ